MGPGVPSVAVFLSWVLGSRPWLFFSHGSLGPVPGCFSSLHVHMARVSSNLPLAFWLTASLAVLSSVSGHTSRDSAFPRGPLAASLRRRHLMSGSSFTPIPGFGSRVSPALVCFFSPDCEFLVVIVHLVFLSRCSVRDFSSGLFLQLHLVVLYSDVASGWSLQHCCVVLCHDVVAGPAPVR